MPPAARLTDMHVCPMQTPAIPPIPHVGGPISGPGASTVLIGNLPASVVGDMAVCVGPPDSVVKGSATVMIMGRPAVRIGDTCAHGGTVVAGFPTVMIGG
ncbi:MAG TPA: PAAR domain-containing protein [Phenylobacterium sp.]